MQPATFDILADAAEQFMTVQELNRVMETSWAMNLERLRTRRKGLVYTMQMCFRNRMIFSRRMAAYYESRALIAEGFFTFIETNMLT